MIQNDSLPSQLGWMKLDKTEGRYLYFNAYLLGKGSTLPSLFSLGDVNFRPGLMYKVHDRRSACYFDICFASTGDYLLASRTSQLFLMVNSPMRRDYLPAVSHEVRGVLLRSSDEEYPEDPTNTRRQSNVQRYRRVCSVVCKSFEIELSGRQGPTQIFDAVYQDWVDGCEYRIYCGMCCYDSSPQSLANNVSTQIYQKLMISQLIESRVSLLQPGPCLSFLPPKPHFCWLTT